MGLSVKHIFFTPVEDAATYLKSDSVVVLGTKDKACTVYKNLCEEKSVKALYIEGADHSLEIVNRPFESISVLENVMKFIEATLS